VAIAPQPAMTTRPASARPVAPSASPHDLVHVVEPPRAWTLTKIAVLLAFTAAGIAVTVAIFAATAYFAVASFR